VQDCSAATQDLLLAATTMDLGAVWTGLHPLEDRVMGMRKPPNLQEHVIPLSLVPIGFPAEQPGRVDRFNAERVHMDRWQAAETSTSQFEEMQYDGGQDHRHRFRYYPDVPMTRMIISNMRTSPVPADVSADQLLAVPFNFPPWPNTRSSRPMTGPSPRRHSPHRELSHFLRGKQRDGKGNEHEPGVDR
jgi:hypothetical protein